MFEIEKDVPIPENAVGTDRRAKYPFNSMEIGDAFFVPGDKKMTSTITSAAQRNGRKYTHWRASKVIDGQTVEGTYVKRIEGETPIKAAKPKAPKADAAPAAAEAPAAPVPPVPPAAAEASKAKPGRAA
jgi:hypothetical protein